MKRHVPSQRAIVLALAAAGAAIAVACSVTEGDVLSTADAGGDAGAETKIDAGADAPADSISEPDGTRDGADGAPDAGPDACATADFTSDPHHCGRCGHDCLGGACTNGVCQPALIAAIVTPGGLAVDDDRVYWTTTVTPGSIYSAAKDGSDRRVLATGQTLPLRLAIDDAYVYWGNGGAGGLRRVAKGGGPDVVVATTSGALIDIGTDATGIYFVDLYGNAIRRAPRDAPDGGFAPAIVNGQDYPWGMAIDDDAVTWTTRGTFVPDAGAFSASDGRILSAPKAIGATPTVLATAQSDPVAVVRDASGIYWLNGQSGTVMRLAPSDAAPVAIATGQTAPSGLTLDATYVYFTCGCDVGGLGRVMRVPKAGGAADVLASSMRYPSAIAVDATAVYWNNIDGDSVMRVAK